MAGASIIAASPQTGCMTVIYDSEIAFDLDHGLLRKMGKMWYQALDPYSYNLTEDGEGYGVYWCDSLGCRNYYRYSRSRLERLLQDSDYTHACPH